MAVMGEEKIRDSRKDLIYKTAVEMIAAEGFAASSIRDICKAVGIKESSFYLSFSKKDEILDEVFAEFSTLFLKDPLPLEKIPPAVERYSPDRILTSALDLCFRRLDDCHIRHLWQILIVEQFRDIRAAKALRKMNRRLAETAAGLFGEWKRRGMIAESVDIASTAEFFASSVRMLFYDYLSQGDESVSFLHERDKLVLYFLSVMNVDRKKGGLEWEKI